ncbi:MAG: 3'(2'),5'-bisphosphate nucleotidase CysQ, partial [Desulfobacterales bacterium]
MNHKIYLLTSIQAALKAGNAILEVYKSSKFKIEKKADKSPLTLADRRSHEVIVNWLKNFDIPILSEEGKDIPYEERIHWDRYWLIDPLDGTKEFIKRNGEFTVNIALIQDQKPKTGVVFVPDKGILYFALEDIGSFKVESNKVINLLEEEKTDSISPEAEKILDQIVNRSVKLPRNDSAQRPFTIIGSRSHATPELASFVEEKRREYGEVEFISAGSSLKLCLVAEGRADIYPRTGPTMEWDTAAGQAIAEFAGAKVLKYDSQEPLAYNKENLLN